MKLALPLTGPYGWGVFADYLSREITKLPTLPDTVTLQGIQDHTFAPFSRQGWNRYNVGLCFLENDIEGTRNIGNAMRYDAILAGSEWCANWLRRAGMHNIYSFTQGVDFDIFYPKPVRKDGRFIVGSFGKAEYRKGHDIVIAAMAKFMDRHDDVWLATCWENQWPETLETLADSKLIRFVRGKGCRDTLMRTMEANGIDMSRVIYHPVIEHKHMAPIYRDTTIGLFPNRCEAGNNMPLTEYMACGKFALATRAHGHLDVSSPLWFMDIPAEPVNDKDVGNWFEPTVDDVVTGLEDMHSADVFREAYEGLAADYGYEGTLSRLTWESCAKTIHGVCEKVANG